MATAAVTRAPVHPLASGALTAAVVAFVLAWYGGLYGEKHTPGSPLNEARGQGGLDAARQSPAVKRSVQVVAFVLPIVLGVGGAVAGGRAMRLVEASGGQYRGDLAAFFAVMLGGLSAATGAVMVLAVFVWPLMPTW